MSAETLAAALELTARGWPVLPLKPRSKAPAVAHGVKDATVDEQTIRAWLRRWPDANLAVAAGAPGPHVLDIDGVPAAGDLPSRCAELGAPTVATARGVQFYFAGTARGTVALGFGELRGVGAYCLVPPSTHPGGKVYTWVASPNGPLPELPAGLVPQGKTAGAGQTEPREHVEPGAMYSYLLDLAVRLASAGERDADVIEQALVAAFELKRVPGSVYGGDARDTRRMAQWAVESQIAGREAKRRESRGCDATAKASQRAYVNETDAKGGLKLPRLPDVATPAALAAWLSHALALDRAHPVTSAAHEGLRGAAGHVLLTRLDAPPLRFEPASRLNTPMRLIEDRTWQAIPSDGPTPALKADHCRKIAHVVRQLCGISKAMSDEDETFGIVGAYLGGATAIDGHTTYGTTGQRYEAAVALRREVDETTGRPTGAARYLHDLNTGELVIRVADLIDIARRFIGGTLAHGWLDARLENAGWARKRLSGHSQPGREGRKQGTHARCDVYVGQLPGEPDDAESVNT